MAEEAQPSAGIKSCILCGVKSEERILLSGVDQGKEVWVCVQCLPSLIHGAH